MIRTILFYVGFLLIIILCTEEFARALRWLRDYVQRYPRRRIIVYPLVGVLTVAAGTAIAIFLIDLATGCLFSYD